jgi:tRNA threonylcarbamoyladenosine biosynthesis protein TsaB
MKIIALETGGTATKNHAVLVALQLEADDASVKSSISIEEPRNMGGQLIQKIDELIAEAGWGQLANVDGLAIASGPGSWTSLRVGFATFKTLSQAMEIPLVAIPSFDALASATQRAILNSLPQGKNKNEIPYLPPHMLLCLMPCRPGEVYGKLFQLSSDHLAQVQGERIAPIKDHLDAAFSQALADEIEGPLLLIGSGANEAAQILTEREEDELFQLLEIPAEAVTVEVAVSGAFSIEAGEVPDLDDLEPLYLAPSSAERNLKLGV